VQVNFAPRGWSAYEAVGENVPSLGRTGMPVAIQMSLQFTETTYVTKEDFMNKDEMGNDIYSKTQSISRF
jgi:hypothetical protein